MDKVLEESLSSLLDAPLVRSMTWEEWQLKYE